MNRTAWYVAGTVILGQVIVWGFALAAARLIPVATTQTSPAPSRPEDAPRMTVAEVMRRQQDPETPLVVDLRQEAEYRTGHIPGAHLVPFANLTSWVTRATPAGKLRLLVLYCACPEEHSSAAAVVQLRQQGFQNAFALLGSWQAWTAAGGRIRTGSRP